LFFSSSGKGVSLFLCLFFLFLLLVFNIMKFIFHFFSLSFLIAHDSLTRGPTITIEPVNFANRSCSTKTNYFYTKCVLSRPGSAEVLEPSELKSAISTWPKNVLFTRVTREDQKGLEPIRQVKNSSQTLGPINYVNFSSNPEVSFHETSPVFPPYAGFMLGLVLFE